MPPRRRAPVPAPIDVEAVRRKLDEGKIVRVGISKSAQFPEGGTGRVKRIGDPMVDGDEYVQVELTLNGTKDVLPFTPGDLTPATRATAATAKPELPLPSASSSSSKSLGQHAARSASPTPTPAPAPAPAPTPALVPAPPSPPSPTDPATPPAEPRPSAARSATLPRPKSKPVRSAKKSPPVTITIATTDTEPPQWKIEARVGVRVVLRSGTVSPARVWELVRQLDEETLTDTVGGILEEQRRSAQARADQLAAELAQVHAELEALPDGRR